MSDLFKGGFAQDIADAWGQDFSIATLTRTVDLEPTKSRGFDHFTGKRDSTTDVRNSTTTYPCRATVETKSMYRDGMLTDEVMTMITILGASLPQGIKPEVGDSITINSDCHILGKLMKADRGEVIYKFKARE